MSTVLAPQPGVVARQRTHVVALARLEAGRMVRNPLLALAVLACAWGTWAYGEPEPWPGAHYQGFPWPAIGLQFATAALAALSFHRERLNVGEATPVREGHRALARLLASVVPVAVSVLALAAMVVRIWKLGGLTLGNPPGATAHAYFTAGELAQPVAGLILAVAVGAAAGRRMRSLAAALTALATGYFITHVYWLFTGPLAPFSIFQSQPVYVDLGPGVDPATLPGDWLLSAPSQYQEDWVRLVVSEPLAWWHDGWLLGLALLLLALALPRPWRRRCAIAGGLLAVVSVVAQYVVYPR
ncbi:hypothetical protein ACH436_00475 [Isoptericola sp. NPDC019693]|uniref:hypothetical protein n=1 Tax=Isoptericola sp. NPDC019693 TaxID=3364009 RepID=UPI0037BA7F78